MKKISLLVSTVDLNLKKNIKFADNIDFSICEVIVVQQLINTNEKLTLDFEAKVVSVKEKGLAKSRNRALANASCNLVLICDDDIQFVKGFEQLILDAYKKYDDAALISFQIKDEEGRPYKDYPKQSHEHTFRSILRVNSIETTFNLNNFSTKKLYDENFGLGAKCPTGEDTIFAVDTYKSKLKCYYKAETIVIHPLESSGKNFNREYPIHRGQVYRRAFGFIGLFLGFLFAVKKYSLYKSKLGFFTFNINFLKGYFSKLN